MQIQRFAQKFVVYEPKRNAILVSKYLTSKYLSEKLSGKYCLPGGKVKFGEQIETSAIREVKEETGVLIKPWEVLNVWTWVYKKETDEIQIFATARVGLYVSGTPKAPSKESETTIGKAFWCKIEKIDVTKFVFDEIPALKAFLSRYFGNA